MMDNQEISKILKKSKRKHLIHTVLISGLVSLILIIAFAWFYIDPFEPVVESKMMPNAMSTSITYPGGERETEKFTAKGDKEIKVTSSCYDKLGADQVVILQRFEKDKFNTVGQATIKCSKNIDNPLTNVTIFNNQTFVGSVKKDGLYSLIYRNKHFPSDTSVQVYVEMK